MATLGQFMTRQKKQLYTIVENDLKKITWIQIIICVLYHTDFNNFPSQTQTIYYRNLKLSISIKQCLQSVLKFKIDLIIHSTRVYFIFMHFCWPNWFIEHLHEHFTINKYFNTSSLKVYAYNNMMEIRHFHFKH